MSLRNIFYKLAHDVSRYPNIVQLTNTLDHGFKEVAEHIQDGGSVVEVTPVYTSGEKLATVTVDDVDNDIYMPNGEVKTMTGDSFTTVNGSLVDEMKVVFTPIQDLHGYSKPWAGGAGKNKLPITISDVKSWNTSGTWSDNVYTLNSTTFDCDVDASGYVNKVTVNGTPSAKAELIIFTGIHNFNGQILTGCPAGGSASNYQQFLQRIGSPWTVYATDSGNGVTIADTPDDISLRINISIAKDYVASGLDFYPMTRLSSIADPTFEPYSNICPISGHTQVQSKINNTTYTTSLGDTYYGGELDMVSGEGESEWVNISSYNGETITEPWLSSLDVYVPHATPTTGAQVVYKTTPTALTLTGQNITAEVGVNNVSAPGTNQEIMEVKYHQMMTIQDVEKLIQ